MDLIALAAYALFGLVVGAYGAMIGAGGGFIIVPVLVIFLGWDHTVAAGTSLFVVAANAASGTLAYLRQRRIELTTGWQFALATFPGAILGSYLAELLSGRLFNLLFGIVMVAVSLYLLLRPERRSDAAAVRPRPRGPLGWGWVERRLTDSQGTSYRWQFSNFWGLVLSVGVGFLSSTLGIGGGIIHVPALIALFSFPVYVATATSLFVLLWSALVGSTTHFFLGNVDLAPGVAMAVGAILGAQLGGALSRRLQARWLVRGLAVALTVVGVRLILS